MAKYKPGPNQPDIKHDIKRPGALTAKAKAAGQSVQQFAMHHMHDGDKTGQQARYYINVLRPAAKAKKK